MSQTTDINAALRRLREDNDRLRAVGTALRNYCSQGHGEGYPLVVQWDAMCAAAPATGDQLLPCVECPSCGFAYANRHFKSGDTCPNCGWTLTRDGDWTAATPPDTTGRTHYDPAHAVAIKDAERDVVEAVLDWFDGKPDSFSRLVIAQSVLRALESGQAYNDDGCTTPEGYEG